MKNMPLIMSSLVTLYTKTRLFSRVLLSIMMLWASWKRQMMSFLAQRTKIIISRALQLQRTPA